MIYTPKNNDLLPPVKIIVVIFSIILSMNDGCEPISVPSPPSDYDKLASINGFVTVDTVAAGSLFNIQVNYRIACDEQFVTLRKENALPRVTFSPIVHRYPDQGCNSPSSIVTTLDTLRFLDAGVDTLIFSGQSFAIIRQITVLPYVPPDTVFKFHFLFRNIQGALPQYTNTFQRLDVGGIKSIQTDTLGYWDTTFADGRTKIKYKIGNLQFEAMRGVKESGVIMIQ